MAYVHWRAQKRRWYYRRFSTVQEKRANQDWPCRGKRRSKNLPDAWVAEKFLKTPQSWKAYRKTQYYPVDM